MGIDKLSISISFLRLVFAKCSSLMFQFVNGDQREVPRDKSDKLIGSQSQCHGNLEAVWCVWYVWQFDIDAGHHPGASPKVQAGGKNISSRGFVSSAQYLFWEIVMNSFSWRTQNSINLVSVNFRKHQWISSWKIADYIHMYIYIPIYQSYPIEHETVGFGAARNRHSPAASSTRSGGEYFGASHHFVEKHTPQHTIPKIHDRWNSSVTTHVSHVSHQFISILSSSHPFSADKVVAPLASIDASQCFTVCPWRSWSSRGEREMTTSLNIPCSVLFHVPCSTDLCAEEWSLRTGICRNMQKYACMQWYFVAMVCVHSMKYELCSEIDSWDRHSLNSSHVFRSY